MNWLYNYFFAEGPGIPKDAPKPKGLRLLAHVFGREWWELIKLNLLFVLFALPLVTLPAAYYALVRICAMMIEDRNVYLMRDFWSAFRSRLAATTLIGAVAAAVAGMGYLAVASYAQASQDSLYFVLPLVVALTVLLALPLYVAHLFAALAINEKLLVREAAVAAAIGVLAQPLAGLSALVFVAGLWLAHIAFYPASVLLPVLVNFSLGGLVTTFAVHRGVQFGFSQTATVFQAGPTRRPKTRSA